MRTFLFFALAAMIIIACNKPSISVPDTITTDLTITQTITPSPISQNQNIVSTIRMTGPNLCYQFSHLEVTQQNPLLFDIRAKATIPNPAKGTPSCPATVYTKDTTFTIATHLTGKHVLRFYNGGQLFKSDTVQVN